jgi:hypothetical protein
LSLSATAKGDINLAVSVAGGGGITTEDNDSLGLAFWSRNKRRKA